MAGRPLCSDEEAEIRGFRGSDCARRRQVLCETIHAFETSDPRDRYHRLAVSNLEGWEANREASGNELRIHVVPGDWGAVARTLTQTYGACFAVLNMANAYAPGGAYVEGAIAQEENMFRRTDCHFHVGPEEYDSALDRYRPEMTRLISGYDGIVYLDHRNPRVCIRGPEDRTRSDLGYAWLADDQVFPFFELRAASQDLRGGLEFDPEDARRRISAQLDTLRGAGVRHAVLGASGCGAFQNPTDQIAKMYREEVEVRTADFSVIAFAIYSSGYGPDNYQPFVEAFGRRRDALPSIDARSPRQLKASKGSDDMQVTSPLSPEEVASLGRLPAEAVAGTYSGEDMSLGDFRPNQVFIDFMHQVIRSAGPRLPDFIAAARRQGDGWLYVIDQRTPDGPQGRVPMEDIIGGFEVESGEIVTDSYWPNESHQVLTPNGLVTLPASLRHAFVETLRGSR